MRSLVLCPYLPDTDDHGGRIRTRVLLTALRRLGPVAVAAPWTGREAERAQRLAAETGGPVHALPAREDRPSPWRKVGCWARGRSEILERRWGAGAAAEVRALLRAQPIDALVVDSSHSLPLLARAPDVPLLVHFHNVESALLGRREAVRRPPREWMARRVEASCAARVEGRAAARARLSITTSERDRELLRALAPGAAIEVVENSVDLARLLPLPASAPDPLRLLFVGSLDYAPNREAVEELLRDHLPVLRRAFPGLQLTIVGRDARGDLTRAARAQGVEATGAVPDVVPYYRAATACYLPLRSGGGTRVKVIEAFALGRPVLATAVAVEGLGVRAGEHFLSIERPADGVAALQRLRADGAGAMVQRARALVERRWSHAAAVDRLVRLIAPRFPSAAQGAVDLPCKG
jgi:glycosyltransferase involved in cell wall biosynthesis